MQAIVESLFIYPVKAARGVAVSAIELDAIGPRGDRRWMIVDEDGRFVTQRQLPALALLDARPDGDAIALSHAGAARGCTAVATPRRAEVTVWRDTVHATVADDGANAWLSRLLGGAFRLVRLETPRAIAVAGTTFSGGLVGFADAYPLLVVTRETIRAACGIAGVPEDVRRFRPNIVIAGVPAWAEDTWAGARIGPISVVIGKACQRCVVIDVDPDRGHRDGRVKDALTQARGVDGKVFVGQNAAHQGVGTLRIGDAVLPEPSAAGR